MTRRFLRSIRGAMSLLAALVLPSAPAAQGSATPASLGGTWVGDLTSQMGCMTWTAKRVKE
jgi:hypothetical protein